MEERGGEEVKIKHHITEPDKQFISLLFALAHHRHFHKNLFSHISTRPVRWPAFCGGISDGWWKIFFYSVWTLLHVETCLFYDSTSITRFSSFVLIQVEKVDIEEIIKSLPGILLTKLQAQLIRARRKDIKI